MTATARCLDEGVFKDLLFEFLSSGGVMDTKPVTELVGERRIHKVGSRKEGLFYGAGESFSHFEQKIYLGLGQRRRNLSQFVEPRHAANITLTPLATIGTPAPATG